MTKGKEPNLQCPECKHKFYKKYNHHEKYALQCPKCKNWEEGCNNHLQYFRVIGDEE